MLSFLIYPVLISLDEQSLWPQLKSSLLQNKQDQRPEIVYRGFSIDLTVCGHFCENFALVNSLKNLYCDRWFFFSSMCNTWKSHYSLNVHVFTLWALQCLYRFLTTVCQFSPLNTLLHKCVKSSIHGELPDCPHCTAMCKLQRGCGKGWGTGLCIQ